MIRCRRNLCSAHLLGTGSNLKARHNYQNGQNYILRHVYAYHTSHILRESKSSTEIPEASSQASLHRKKSSVATFCFRSTALIGGSFTILGVGLLGLFIYDAYKNSGNLSYDEIQVSELALNPRLGGPKNLPIVEVQIDDNDSEDHRKLKEKPRLVILGSGWGSVALLKTLDPDMYHVTIVSPTNYFLFTPLLPSATNGTLELRSLVEPIRRIVSRVRGHFIRARAENVEFSEKLVEISQVDLNGEKKSFYLPYDKLIIGVGSTTNPHGVKGLENCHSLKDIGDAQRIKDRILSNLEYACLPTTSDDERKRLLSFVICGGGPTGVEFSAELIDLLNEDLIKYFPKLLRNEVSVHLIQSRSHILNTYDESISKYAEQRFARDQINILTESRVKEVQPDKIIFTQKHNGVETVTKELPMGFCLWSTGVSQTEFCQRISDALGLAQKNKHALETDTQLRLNGTTSGDVYAIGDCATVQNNITDHLISFLRTRPWKNIKDAENVQITFAEWRIVAQQVRSRFPQAAEHLKRLDKLFEAYDLDHSGTLDFNELRQLLMEIDSKLTSLPATAQRAHQQGQYLGKKLNKMARESARLGINDVKNWDSDEAVFKAFKYHHLGSLAYIGNSAVFDLGNGLNLAGGLWAMYAWRSVYFTQSVSLRTRILLAMDWAKKTFFGRDLMNW
ncbi:External alternative NADH-ubiquinone oxidoreductase B1, mitochondrial [Golovinomyces cichoracearum]|uniref:External alternative NADH-ubiquinone oxidoreductase B1, mitochondrial n=1 Tax=Golovinomyces cichoracearum TaxID=62708 RepID=A0A420I725_9PEZI|nr:External alternative NADH-ubiquinone oxidoreductase B1, mitochondrial [Golovinomyces cichoracearum]